MDEVKQAEMIVSEFHDGDLNTAIIRYSRTINKYWGMNKRYEQFLNHFWAMLVIKCVNNNQTFKEVMDKYDNGYFQIVGKEISRRQLYEMFRSASNSKPKGVRELESALHG